MEICYKGDIFHNICIYEILYTIFGLCTHVIFAVCIGNYLNVCKSSFSFLVSVFSFFIRLVTSPCNLGLQLSTYFMSCPTFISPMSSWPKLSTNKNDRKPAIKFCATNYFFLSFLFCMFFLHKFLIFLTFIC